MLSSSATLRLHFNTFLSLAPNWPKTNFRSCWAAYRISWKKAAKQTKRAREIDTYCVNLPPMPCRRESRIVLAIDRDGTLKNPQDVDFLNAHTLKSINTFRYKTNTIYQEINALYRERRMVQIPHMQESSRSMGIMRKRMHDMMEVTMIGRCKIQSRSWLIQCKRKESYFPSSDQNLGRSLRTANPCQSLYLDPLIPEHTWKYSTVH